jgi:hypothetical protein
LRLSLEEVAGKRAWQKRPCIIIFHRKTSYWKRCIRSISYDFQKALSVLDSKEYRQYRTCAKGFMQINSLFTELSPMFFLWSDAVKSQSGYIWTLIGSGLFKQKMEANLNSASKAEFTETISMWNLSAATCRTLFSDITSILSSTTTAYQRKTISAILSSTTCGQLFQRKEKTFYKYSLWWH